jgi:selenide,water dikinase
VLPLDYLARILLGGAEIARLAEATIVGGHTVDDPEPKYGLAVTGVVRPGEELTNAGARPGDVLVLTKPLGTGVIATAIKQGTAPPDVVAAATASMATLNRAGAEVARACGARALTDITGFGLLGHLTELCRASGVAADVWYDRLPILPGAEALAQHGVVPGGTKRNLEFVQPWTYFDPRLEYWQRLLCADAQTSGGLVVVVPSERRAEVVQELESRALSVAAVIGRVLAQEEARGSLLRVRSAGTG